MRIILTTFYLPPTDRIGSGVQMHMLANEYAKLGHVVTVLSPSPICEDDAKYIFKSVCILGKFRALKWAYFLSRYHFDADIVHFSGDDFLVPNVSRYVHLRTFMGSCFAEARVATRFGNRIRMFALGLTEYISSLKFSFLTVISIDTNRYISRKGKLVPCGVDLKVFTPGSMKHVNPVVLFVGMLDSRKRGRQLVEVFQKQVRAVFPNAELWIVRESEGIDLPGVTVFGSVTQAQLVDLYQRAWVFCLPSAYEGFGVPYVEAMACGTAVVATDNPGAQEVLESGKYGLIVQLDNLGDSLCELLHDAARRRKMEEMGVERARLYEIGVVAQQYIDYAKQQISDQLS